MTRRDNDTWAGCSSLEAGQIITDSLTSHLAPAGHKLANPNEDKARLGNIRLLAHTRSTQKGMEVRDRCLWSMQNLLDQIKDTDMRQLAQIIIMTSKRV